MKTSLPFHWPLALALSLAALMVGSAHAGTYLNDFNTDPTSDPNFSLRGNAVWRPTGGWNVGGYISLTDAIGSQQGTVVIPDFDGGAVVVGFNLKMKVRVGGGTSRPADGLSVSFADATDGIVGGGTVGEEGTATGLSVNLDTWDNGNGDGPAMDVKVDGTIIAHKRFAGIGSPGLYCAPVEQDEAGSPISLETDLAGTPAPGNWVDFEMNLHSCGTLTVKYKGVEIFKDLVTGYGVGPARVGRFVIGARTGDATDNHWIDDLQIMTYTGDPPPRVALASPAVELGQDVSENSPVQFVIDYTGSFYEPNLNSIHLTLDGTDVTGNPNTAIVDDLRARATTITYTSSTPWIANSPHEAVLTFTDLNEPPVACTARKIFHVMSPIVTTPYDDSYFPDGTCLRTLRRALKVQGNGATVTFAPNVTGTILLTDGELLINKRLSIVGPGASRLAISGNNASRVFHIGPQGNVNISGLTITEGHVSAGGGGIAMNGGFLTVSNCAIEGCYAQGVDVASQGGGAIAVIGAANLTVIGSTLSSNTARYYGGAIFLFNTPKASLVNCTVSGNRTLDGINDEAWGGGIYVVNGSTLNVTNSTIANNSSVNQGGGIYKGLSGTVTLRNSLVAGNSAGDLGPDCKGTFVSAGYNLIGNASGSTGFGATGDQLNLNAQIGALADNGGPTFTHALLAGSPAIDKGANSGGLTTDQRGGVRPLDTAIANATGGDGNDIGAVEAGGYLSITDLRTNGPQVNISFTTDPGWPYSLESKDALAPGPWTLVPGSARTGNGSVLTVPDTRPRGPKRFYRAVMTP